MEDKYMQLEELTKSRMVMEHKILPLGILSLYGLIIIIALSLLWAYFGELDVVVKARGTLRPNAAVSTLSSKVSGRLNDVAISPEQGTEVFVEKGQLLYQIDDKAYRLEQKGLREEEARLVKELEMTNRFISGIENSVNPFDAKEEARYFFEFEKLQMQQQIDKNDQALLVKQLASTQDQLAQAKALHQLLSANARTVPKAMTGFKELKTMLSAYWLEFDSLSRALSSAEKEEKTSKVLMASGSLSSAEMEAATLKRQTAQMALESYTVNYEIDLTKRIETLKTSYDSECAALDNNGVAGESGNQLENGGLVIWSANKNTLENELSQIRQKLEAVSLGIENCQVKAEVSGTFSPSEAFAVGDQISEGTSLGVLVPSGAKACLAEMAIGNVDIGQIKVGSRVKLKLDALPYKEYGFVEGRIIAISPDAIYDKVSGASYYKAVASIEAGELKSYKGEAKQLLPGMAFEAHAVTERKQILKIFFEKLQLSL